VDPLLPSRKQAPEYGMETSDIVSQKEIQNSIIGGKNDVETSLGCTRANFGTIPREEQLEPAIRTKCQGLLSKDVPTL
jgi:hypothetical protein